MKGKADNKFKMVLFDLDGTLLPMDMKEFSYGYFGDIMKRAVPAGYEPQKLIDTIWKGCAVMALNDGSRLNREVFWDNFAETYGEERRKDKQIFDDFYATEFRNAKRFCGYNPKAVEAVKRIKEMGYRVALATNPIFPEVATKIRLDWLGLSFDDFELVTTYDNCCYAKPNLKYYIDVTDRLGVKPEDCLMVGNDVGEDMVAKDLGMEVFLITDTMINKENKDISVYPNGSFEDLMETYF